MKNKNHYLYYSYEEWGRGYLGVRSCSCSPELDLKYFGSFTDKTFVPTQKIIIAEFQTRKEAAAAEIIVHDFFNVAVNTQFANKAKATTTGFDRTGVTHTNEAKQKVSEANAGRIHTDETKQKMSLSHIGKPRTDGVRQKIKKGNIGKKRTNETRQRISEARKGEKHPQFGKPLADETKEKLRVRNTGEKNPRYGVTVAEETKQKMSEAHMGHTHTEETKQKMSISHTGENHNNFGKSWYVNSVGETCLCEKSPGPGWQKGRKFKG